MPTQPYARKFFKLSSGSSTSVETGQIDFPFRRWDDGIVILAASYKLQSGSDTLTIELQMFYQDVGWTSYKKLADDDGNTSWSVSTSEGVVAISIDSQSWWKVCQGIRIRFSTASTSGLEVRCAILAK